MESHPKLYQNLIDNVFAKYSYKIFHVYADLRLNVPLNEAQKKEYMCSKKPLH